MKNRSDVCQIDKERVYKEYGMTPQSIARDVDHIKQWMMKQPHLPKIQPEQLMIQVDDWLENYLISCKNSLEKVKEGLDMYFTGKIIIPEVYACRDPLTPGFEKSFEVMSLAFVPQLTIDDRKLIIFSHKQAPTDEFDPLFMFRRVSMMLDILLLEGVNFVGLEIVVDCKNVCFSQLGRYNLPFTKKVFDVCLKSIPHRIAKIHVVNPHSTIEACMAFFRPLISKKLSDRYVVHTDLAKFAQSVGPKVAPRDLGGENDTIESLNSLWQKKLIDYRDWFSVSSSLKSDESKRIGKCRFETSDSCFGNQGSFRKIEVD
ncbi:transfer protein [Nesidiocoris tenuis]|uniref:Transfer protein n=1 Tax=Nesidiocoris tenuis TaxID=355587 RepID=A0ABN7ASM2_9HEMI|nr:transfer protein [Nesidiocoris tenuis]